jgi:hypothetical protein
MLHGGTSPGAGCNTHRRSATGPPTVRTPVGNASLRGLTQSALSKAGFKAATSGTSVTA